MRPARRPSPLRRSALATAALGAMLMAAPATASTDEIWARYDADATAYEALQAECDAGDRATTRGDRVCREAADASAALAATIEALLAADDSLSAEDRELLVDGMVTNLQIAGALWVELGECDGGVAALEALLARPELEPRPLVRQAAQDKLAEGQRCIAARDEALAVAASPADGADGAGSPSDDLASPSPARRASPAPLILIGAGAAVLGGGVVWDVAQGGMRSDFEALRDTCGGLCPAGDDRDRQLELRDSIDGAKLPVTLMYAGGAAIATAGLVWRLAARGDDDGATAATVSPVIGVRTVGLRVSAR